MPAKISFTSKRIIALEFGSISHERVAPCALANEGEIRNNSLTLFPLSQIGYKNQTNVEKVPLTKAREKIFRTFMFSPNKHTYIYIYIMFVYLASSTPRLCFLFHCSFPVFLLSLALFCHLSSFGFISLSRSFYCTFHTITPLPPLAILTGEGCGSY